jgi:ABC-type oligopeptide transport system substrate-binding subunit
MRLSRTAARFLPLLLTACAPAGDWFGKTTCERPETLVLNNSSEPQTLDPALMQGNIEGRVADALFEGLTGFHPQTLEPVPGVATDWQTHDGARRFTFRLRTNARWSDGTPLSAVDFRLSWLRLLDPATGSRYASFLFPIEGAEAFHGGKTTNRESVGIEAPDVHTLVVRLREPTPYFPSLTAFYVTMPVPLHAIARHGAAWTRPEHFVGNGPFRLAAHRMHREIVVEKSPTYWGRERVRLARIVFLPIEDAGTALNLYRTGEIDLLFDYPLEMHGYLRSKKDRRVAPGWGIYYYSLNTTRPPLDDVRVRRALSLAVDRTAIAGQLLGQGQLPAASFTPPVLPWYRPPALARRDAPEARRLLAAAGYPGGTNFPPLALLFNTSESHRHVAEVVRDQWRRELGITVSLENQEWKVYLDTTATLRHQVARKGWIGDFPDPLTFLGLFLPGDGNNTTGWTDPRYTALVKTARDEAEPRARAAAFAAAERLLLEESPVIPLYVYAFNILVKPYVHGVFPNALDFHPLRDIHIGSAP